MRSICIQIYLYAPVGELMCDVTYYIRVHVRIMYILFANARNIAFVCDKIHYAAAMYGRKECSIYM